MPQRRKPSRSSSSTRYPIDRRRLLVGTAVLCTVSVSVGAALVVGWWARPSPSSPPAPPRAVIVDQLAFTDPDPAFVSQASAELRAAGYVVDYIGEDLVTVDLYRALPSHGYRLVVLRSHSSDARYSVGRTSEVPEVGLFTNEPYSRSEHVDEQRAQQLTIDSYEGRTDRYFGVEPSFIASRAEGRFDHATVILMGCAGLKVDDMARAFIDRGAADFISWDAAVTATHTDAATTDLLHGLLALHLTPSEAVKRTMASVGPDPSFGARLASYP